MARFTRALVALAVTLPLAPVRAQEPGPPAKPVEHYESARQKRARLKEEARVKRVAKERQEAYNRAHFARIPGFRAPGLVFQQKQQQAIARAEQAKFDRYKKYYRSLVAENRAATLKPF